MTRLLTVKNAAKYIDAGEDTIRNMLASGALTRYELGPRLTRVSVAELEGLIEACRVDGESKSTGESSQQSGDMEIVNSVVALERLTASELSKL